jgi:hypothetical protein
MVSSTEVRRLIEAGNVSLACRLLERPYSVEGEIVSGHGIGSKQTVPTLNLRTSAEVLPADGVYITRTTDTEDGRSWQSITNIGMRPTFEGDRRTIETFLLSPFDGRTPERIRLAFLRRVREERKFESPDALKRQILRDVAIASRFFRKTSVVNYDFTTLTFPNIPHGGITTMPMVSMRQLLDEAAKGGYGVGAFNVNNMEQIQAIMEAAQETKSPVIVTGEPWRSVLHNDRFLYHLMIAATELYPEIPIALHQDHGNSPETCKSASRWASPAS